MKCAILAVVGLCAACAPTGPKLDPKLVTQKVEVAVASSCVPKTVSKAPVYPDAGLTQDTDAAERYLLEAAANLMRKARLADIEPVVELCRLPDEPSAP